MPLNLFRSGAPIASMSGGVVRSVCHASETLGSCKASLGYFYLDNIRVANMVETTAPEPK